MCGTPERCASTVDTHSQPNGVMSCRRIHRRTRSRNRSPRLLNSRYTSASRLFPRKCSCGLSVSTRKTTSLGAVLRTPPGCARTAHDSRAVNSRDSASCGRSMGCASSSAGRSDSKRTGGWAGAGAGSRRRPARVEEDLPNVLGQGSRSPETAGPIGPRFRLRRLIPVSTRTRAPLADVGGTRDHARASPAPRVRTDLSTAEMIELRAQGLTPHEIGQRLGCTRSAVRWRLRRV